MSYLDITNSFGEGRGDQHGCRGDDVCGEEYSAKFAFRQIELALEEVGHPGAEKLAL